MCNFDLSLTFFGTLCAKKKVRPCTHWAGPGGFDHTLQWLHSYFQFHAIPSMASHHHVPGIIIHIWVNIHTHVHVDLVGRHMAKGSISKLWLFVRISALGKLRALFPLVASACLNNASFPRYLWPFCHFFVSFYGKTVYLEIEKKDRYM